MPDLAVKKGENAVQNISVQDNFTYHYTEKLLKVSFGIDVDVNRLKDITMS